MSIATRLCWAFGAPDSMSSEFPRHSVYRNVAIVLLLLGWKGKGTQLTLGGSRRRNNFILSPFFLVLSSGPKRTLGKQAGAARHAVGGHQLQAHASSEPRRHTCIHACIIKPIREAASALFPACVSSCHFDAEWILAPWNAASISLMSPAVPPSRFGDPAPADDVAEGVRSRIDILGLCIFASSSREHSGRKEPADPVDSARVSSEYGPGVCGEMEMVAVHLGSAWGCVDPLCPKTETALSPEHSIRPASRLRIWVCTASLP